MLNIPKDRVQKVALCSDPEVRPPSALAVSLAAAERLTDIGRPFLLKAICEGELVAVKAGPRLLILMDSLRNFIASLPRVDRAAGQEKAA